MGSRTHPLSREEILLSALELLDAEGLAALSMRRLGRRLGVEAMSLYRYVRNKEDLLDGLHETVLAELPPPPTTGTWQERAAKQARALRRVLLAHPNAAPLFATRPAVAPGSLARADAALEIFADAGLSPRDQLAALHALLGYVVGSVLAVVNWQGPGSAGVDYGALDPERYPNLRRLAPAIAREDAEYEFEFGLQALIAGIERGAAPSHLE